MICVPEEFARLTDGPAVAGAAKLANNKPVAEQSIIPLKDMSLSFTEQHGDRNKRSPRSFVPRLHGWCAALGADFGVQLLRACRQWTRGLLLD